MDDFVAKPLELDELLAKLAALERAIRAAGERAGGGSHDPVAPRAWTRSRRQVEAEHARIGRYEILERIGVGGMAEAFRARAHGPGGYQRELVIKRILPHLAEDPDFVRAFVDEAKILGMLNHPNVVGVYDFGEDQGRHYLALEFLDGPSLAAICRRGRSRRASTSRSGSWPTSGKEICNGLSAVHTAPRSAGRPAGASSTATSPPPTS